MWLFTMIMVGRCVLSLGRADRPVQFREIVHVADMLHIPVPGQEARRNVVGKRQRRVALNRDVVVVVKPDEVRQSEVPGNRRRLVGNTFHQVAVAADRVDAVVEQIMPILAEASTQTSAAQSPCRPNC